MPDRIEVVLLHTLEQAKGAVQIAKDVLDKAEEEHASRQRDVDNCVALLAHHRRLTAAEPLTEVFPAVPPAVPATQAAPVPLPVALADIQENHVYLDSRGTAWVWKGGYCDSERHDSQVPVLRSANSHAPADRVISEYGPLRAAPNVVELAPPVDSHPTGAHQLPDPAATLTDPPATPKDGA